jgi:hypothetical protein
MRTSVVARVMSILTATTLICLPSTISANDCKDVPSGGFICPDSLPDLPEWNLAKRKCAKGCYLYPPERAKAAAFDAEKALLSEERRVLIDKLQLHIKDLQLVSSQFEVVLGEVQDQRDAALTDVATLKIAVIERDTHIGELEKIIENSYTFKDLAIAAGVGAGIVSVAGLVVVLIFAVK